MALFEGIGIGLVLGVPGGAFLYWMYAKKLIADAQAGIQAIGKKA